MKIGWGPLNVLDFDIESRPLGWYGGDWVHQEITAIGWAWVEDHMPRQEGVLLLTKAPVSQKYMLKKFLELYAAADLVTGHFIRGFDLPQINAACLEVGLGPLGPKLTSDTKSDLIKFQGMSKSQENLGSILGIPAPKVAMSQAEWREVNRLTPKGRELVTERVLGDVHQHIELRKALLEAGFLDAPKIWSPGAGGRERYTP